MATQIGPFLIVTGTKTEKSLVGKVQTCSNGICSNNVDNKVIQSPFCPACGCKTIKKSTCFQREIDPEELLSNNDEYIDDLVFVDKTVDGESIFISNRNNCPTNKDGRDNITYGDYLDLSSVDIKNEMESFANQDAAVIEYLKKELGPNAVQIKWGTVNT